MHPSLLICFLVVLMSGYVSCQLDQCDSRALMSRMNALENRVDKLENEKEGLQDKVDRLENEKRVLEATVNQMQQTTQNIVTYKEYNDTLFLAAISEYTMSISPGDAIIYDVEVLNPGGHYNNLLGAYTAPYHGYYSFSITKNGHSYSAGFYFLVDEERYYNYDIITSNDISPAGSATINIELQAGQIVRVENQRSNTIYGTSNRGWIYSWFTGYLLFPL